MNNSQYRFDMGWYDEARRQDLNSGKFEVDKYEPGVGYVNQQALEIAIGPPPPYRNESPGPVLRMLRVYDDEPFRPVFVIDKYIQWIGGHPVSTSGRPIYQGGSIECECSRRKRIQEEEQYRRRMLMIAGVIACM